MPILKPATFKIHAGALTTVTTSLHGQRIRARARHISPRVALITVCETKKDLVKNTLMNTGYGSITFCQN